MRIINKNQREDLEKKELLNLFLDGLALAVLTALLLLSPILLNNIN